MENVTNWRKASYSGTNGGICVEASNYSRYVLVRDSQDQDGAQLPTSPDSWSAVIRSVTSDKYAALLPSRRLVGLLLRGV